MGKDLPVVGVGFANEDGVSRQTLLSVLYDRYYTEGLERKIRVELVPEPENPVDPGAVAVYVRDPEESRGRVGFVPADLAPSISRLLSSGRVGGVAIRRMSISRRGRVGLVLRLRPVGSTARVVRDSEGRVYELE